jgi:hypothetical protein
MEARDFDWRTSSILSEMAFVEIDMKRTRKLGNRSRVVEVFLYLLPASGIRCQAMEANQEA